jgi:hypothetical protein
MSLAWCYAYNPNTGEAKAGGSRVQGQPGLHSKTPSQKNKKNPLTKAVIYYTSGPMSLGYFLTA